MQYPDTQIWKSMISTKLKLYNTCILSSSCTALSAGQLPRELCWPLILLINGVWKLLGIKWYHRVRNDDVRRTTKQRRLSAVVQARHFSLYVHIVQMRDQTDAKKILTASFPLENWRRPQGHPCITCMKTIQQELKSSNHSVSEATDMAQNCPLRRLMSTFGDAHSCCSELRHCSMSCSADDNVIDSVTWRLVVSKEVQLYPRWIDSGVNVVSCFVLFRRLTEAERLCKRPLWRPLRGWSFTVRGWSTIILSASERLWDGSCSRQCSGEICWFLSF